ncbi:MAG: Membrane protein insertase MisCB precursor [bacterium ADurb.Bin400]|nr:MAG: Membrane protein insertase MisCB precursor [bacterium ADurb.Bin400]
MSHLIEVLLYQPLYNLLILFAWLTPSHSIGWAIILLTIVVRLALLPSSLKAAKAQAKLQALRPQILEIQKKYKDHAEQSRQLFALYKREGVSQFGSCLPLLIQIPIMFALYSVFRHSINGSSYDLLYAITPRPETMSHFFLGLDLSTPEMWVLPILAGASQFVLSMLTMKAMPQTSGAMEDQAQMMMKQMNYIFPVATIFIARMFPAALALYWVVSTVFGVVQQLYFNKIIKKEAAEFLAARATNKKELPVSTPTSDSPKRGYLEKVMEKRMEKEEKRTGVTVSIRKKS